MLGSWKVRLVTSCSKSPRLQEGIDRFSGQEMTYSQGLGWGIDREHHLGLEAPFAEDLVICDPKLVAHSHFWRAPTASLPTLPPPSLIPSGDPVIIHVPFWSLRGLIEGEQEISLVLGQPLSKA